MLKSLKSKRFRHKTTLLYGLLYWKRLDFNDFSIFIKVLAF